ncbi:hypothetical protein TsFJ059_004970 [Trichoderma semiorbis]|uniref:Uncharacterized protein n=1 Tax=Trichoderma semiorbis TaxID=1491008 RepID=A0A9P8HUU0_9HYPO|nr:hypothetical protein TsFJ059_004970 [Trichoderma semiorbis]
MDGQQIPQEPTLTDVMNRIDHMLACALANTVKQVGESFGYSNPSPGSYNQILYDASGMNYIPGDAFYLAAKKRLGLLDVTLTSVQCFFLAGLYESSMFWSDCIFPVVELSETFEKSSTFHQRVLLAYTFLESFQVSPPGPHSTAV